MRMILAVILTTLATLASAEKINSEDKTPTPEIPTTGNATVYVAVFLISDPTNHTYSFPLDNMIYTHFETVEECNTALLAEAEGMNANLKLIDGKLLMYFIVSEGFASEVPEVKEYIGSTLSATCFRMSLHNLKVKVN